jgi:hypothetical protein
MLWTSQLIKSNDGVDFAILFTLRESRRTSDPSLFRRRRTVSYPPQEDFTLDALTLKPSGFCNLGVTVMPVEVSETSNA